MIKNMASGSSLELVWLSQTLSSQWQL
jgi:hypothetical protein